MKGDHPGVNRSRTKAVKISALGKDLLISGPILRRRSGRWFLFGLVGFKS
jgi:hypothetical protein